jgi:hypothetical protein
LKWSSILGYENANPLSSSFWGRDQDEWKRKFVIKPSESALQELSDEWSC